MGMINVRNLSVRCGNCSAYQTLVGFARRDDGWNVYTYECEGPPCEREATRTFLEVPATLDEFANRDPGWHGGARHAGADHGGGHGEGDG